MKPKLGIFSLALTAHLALAQAPPRPTSEDVLNAYRAGSLAAMVLRVEEGLKQELPRKKLDHAAITRLASLRSFAQRFGSSSPLAPEDSRTLEWLVAQPSLGPLFFTALAKEDHPARALAVLSALRTKYPKALEAAPDLAVATAVVWDSPNREGQTLEAARDAGVEVFGYLFDNRRSLRTDWQTLPWMVLTFLVDSRITGDERRWAMESYRLPPEPGRAYFSIRYDWKGFESGRWRGGSDPQNYTLANLIKLGGVCKDQAYFASEACRAYGVPATVCTGSSAEGEGFHAWVGVLRVSKNRAMWDFETARYAEHGFWSGVVIDPQTGQKLTDGEVALNAEWCGVPRDRRLLSLALAQSLDLVEIPLRIELAKAAIEAAPGNAQAWMALARQCMKPDTPPALLREVAGVVERFAVGRYDDFAFKIYGLLISGRAPEEQLTVLDRTTRLFPQRPDLLAELALRKGDALAKLSKPNDALRMYESVLTEALHYGPLALDAMTRLESLLKPAGRTDQLIKHYRTAWTRMVAPKPSGYAWTTPWYLMGERYAKALDEAGENAAAQKVRQTIRERDLSRRNEK